LKGSVADLFLPLHVPNAATLTAVAVSLKPAAGHPALPEHMPTLEVWRYTAGTLKKLGSTVVDDSLKVDDYEVPHDLAVAGFSELVNRSVSRCYAVLRSEGGPSALQGLEMVDVKVTYSPLSYDED
jgi:hypothetical protein